MDKVGNQLCPIGRVDDFGVELRAIKAARIICDHGKGRTLSCCHHAEAGGEGRYLVAMPPIDQLNFLNWADILGNPLIGCN